MKTIEFISEDTEYCSSEPANLSSRRCSKDKFAGESRTYISIIVKEQTLPLLIALVFLLINGCCVGPVCIKKLISPAQAEYDLADSFFQKKDYKTTISAYEQFIKDYPQSKLIPGAYLEIAWSHFLSGEFKETLDSLAQVRTQDQGLKSWMEKLQNEAKKRLGETHQGAPTLFNIPPFTNQEKLKIEGSAPDGGKVVINGQQSNVSAGLFSQEITLSEGENIIKIEITDKTGKTDTQTAKVTLDRTPPEIKVTSAELNDFGYVQMQGITKPGAKLTAEGELFNVDQQGNFSGQVKITRGQQINLVVEDQAGNIAKTVFSDTTYPDKPTGLRIVSTGGSTADIAWNDNRETNLKGYNVYYSSPGEFSDKKNNRDVITKNTYTVTDLRSGSTYKIYVRAVTKMGNESEPSYETLTLIIP